MNELPPNATVAVVGLGYVGLPLAVAFGRRFATIGFDIAVDKVAAYREGMDPAGSLSSEELREASRLRFTTDAANLAAVDFVIVAVPTPVDAARQPDFGPLRAASREVGAHMKRGATVIYESTVYPGATEDICVPVLEKASGMKWKADFHIAYSPERINPGDKEHTLERIVKVVAGDDEATLRRVAALYGAVIPAGTYSASSIRVAEAAKVIENTQRDLNIALMNELAIIFDRLRLDTHEILEAAGTKWNFLRFEPGLVGGHCIGVDPYYLTHRAEIAGYHPQVVLAGRRINDGMGKFIAEKTVKLMAAVGRALKGGRVTILGLTFKEDVPDLRNSRVPDIVEELRSYGIDVDVCDPLAEPSAAKSEYGIELRSWESLTEADALIVAVAHRRFTRLTPETLAGKLVRHGVVVDVKACLDRSAFASAGYRLWRL
jgi:UDP-N-acetyl-D-galactosamine dehydrogenase